jgi:hypothetical protein
MSSGNPLTNIVMAAADLKAVAPQMFGKLVDALRTYEAQAIVEAVNGDEPREIFRAQGKVKVIKSLRKHLQECSELRATYERRGPNA